MQGLPDRLKLPVASRWLCIVRNAAIHVQVCGPFVDHHPKNSKDRAILDCHRSVADWPLSANGVP